MDSLRPPWFVRMLGGVLVGMVLSGRLTQLTLSLLFGVAIGATAMWLYLHLRHPSPERPSSRRRTGSSTIDGRAVVALVRESLRRFFRPTSALASAGPAGATAASSATTTSTGDRAA
jgi:uncharacterized membrane protein YfcA